MKIADLNKDTMGQLINGQLFKAEDGTLMILGETDVVAFLQPHVEDVWQVAEGVHWNRVEDLRKIEDNDERLRGLALQWIYDHGQRIYEGISADIAEWAGTKLTKDEQETLLALIEGSTVEL